MTTLPLDEAASVTLDASGNGTVKVGPNAHGVVWHPGVVSVKTSTVVKSPTVLIYVGSSISDGAFIDGSYSGGQNASDNIKGQVLRLGQFVWAVFSGGDVGAQATVSVSGTKDIG